MRLSRGIIKDGVFKERLNQYLVLVELNGRPVEVFLPNPGRMKELLIPGARVHLREEPGEHRKTHHDLISIYSGDILISLDSRLPNSLIADALEKNDIPELTGYKDVKKEPKVGKSRLDFLLGGTCLIEVKSCTLVNEGVAMFPDAPTSRGKRHMEELESAVRTGMRGVVFFLVQRPDAERFRPNDETDPLFGEALRSAVSAGVEALAYTTKVEREEVQLGKKISVDL